MIPLKPTPKAKELNKQIKGSLNSIASWTREIKGAMKEINEEYKLKNFKNSSDAIYRHAVRLCDLISDYNSK